MKILIGTPIEESKAYCVAQYFQALRELEVGDHVCSVLIVLTLNPTIVFKAILDFETRQLADLGKYEEVALMVDRDTQRMKPSYQAVEIALSKIRELFLEKGYDALFNVDADNPPPREALTGLLCINADIAGAVIFQRPRPNWGLKPLPLVFEYMYPLPEDPKLHDAWKLGFLKPKWDGEEAPKEGVYEADAIGLGCSVIKRKVMEEFEFKKGILNTISPEFCHQARMRGFEIRVDMGLHCPHLKPDGGSV